MACRLANCVFYRPSTIESSADCGLGYTSISRPAWKCFCFPVNGQKYVVTLVVCLLERRCPSAIFRAVVCRVVDAIETVVRTWPASHVREKSVERLPSNAYPYSPCSIVLPLPRIRVLASGLHRRPYHVFRRRTFSSRTTVSGEGFRSGCSASASARPCVPIFEVVPVHDGFFSAVATTEPHRLFSDIFCSLFNQKTAKP